MDFSRIAARFHSGLVAATEVLSGQASTFAGIWCGRKWGAVAVLAVLAMPMYSCSARNTVQLNDNPNLGCEISGEASYRSGEPAIFEFRLENRSARELYVLKWHTPLEGIISRVFKVSRDGEELEYLGMMVRRGNPVADDYVEIAPGNAASASFDLAEVYDLDPPGVYHLEFASKILDVATDRSDVPRPLDRHEPIEIECNVISFAIQK